MFTNNEELFSTHFSTQEINILTQNNPHNYPTNNYNDDNNERYGEVNFSSLENDTISFDTQSNKRRKLNEEEDNNKNSFNNNNPYSTPDVQSNRNLNINNSGNNIVVSQFNDDINSNVNNSNYIDDNGNNNSININENVNNNYDENITSNNLNDIESNYRNDLMDENITSNNLNNNVNNIESNNQERWKDPNTNEIDIMEVRNIQKVDYSDSYKEKYEEKNLNDIYNNIINNNNFINVDNSINCNNKYNTMEEFMNLTNFPEEFNINILNNYNGEIVFNSDNIVGNNELIINNDINKINEYENQVNKSDNLQNNNNNNNNNNNINNNINNTVDNKNKNVNNKNRKSTKNRKNEKNKNNVKNTKNIVNNENVMKRINFVTRKGRNGQFDINLGERPGNIHKSFKCYVNNPFSNSENLLFKISFTKRYFDDASIEEWKKNQEKKGKKSEVRYSNSIIELSNEKNIPMIHPPCEGYVANSELYFQAEKIGNCIVFYIHYHKEKTVALKPINPSCGNPSRDVKLFYPIYELTISIVNNNQEEVLFSLPLQLESNKVR